MLHILNEIHAIWHYVLEGQQRDMRQGFLVYIFSLRPQIFHDVIDFYGIPVQDCIGNQA